MVGPPLCMCLTQFYPSGCRRDKNTNSIRMQIKGEKGHERDTGFVSFITGDR